MNKHTADSMVGIRLTLQHLTQAKPTLLFYPFNSRQFLGIIHAPTKDHLQAYKLPACISSSILKFAAKSISHFHILHIFNESQIHVMNILHCFLIISYFQAAYIPSKTTENENNKSLLLTWQRKQR